MVATGFLIDCPVALAQDIEPCLRLVTLVQSVRGFSWGLLVFHITIARAEVCSKHRFILHVICNWQVILTPLLNIELI